VHDHVTLPDSTINSATLDSSSSRNGCVYFQTTGAADGWSVVIVRRSAG
jgi:hypothetical protein